MPEIKTQTLNGIDFAYYEVGEGPLLLCLHGFPDSADTFLGIAPALAAAGYRVVMPYLRGYYPSGLSAEGDYSMLAIGRDVLAWVEAFRGDGPAYVYGHDWGGMAAIAAANMQPSAIDRMVVSSVPHMEHGAWTLGQFRKSWYVMFFQLPWLPEWRVALDNFAFIDRLYQAWSPHWDASQWQLGPVKKALGMPGGLKAALGYYRGMIRSATREQWQLLARPVTVPTLVICGDADGSVGIDQFDRLERAYTGELAFLRVPGAGHFPHREAADVVTPSVCAFLRGAPEITASLVGEAS